VSNKKPQIKYKSGYKYQLVEDYFAQIPVFPKEDIDIKFISLTKKGSLMIRHGYAWDGPSGPTVDTLTFMRGSLVHDAVYQLIRLGLLDGMWRLEADEELRRICLADGMWSFRAWYVYHSVRWAGKSSALPENKKEIIAAPK